MKPVRIQRKRAKGFNLQDVSLALNGLSAVVVTRPGRWGNPFDSNAGPRFQIIEAYRALMTLDWKWFRRNSGYSWTVWGSGGTGKTAADVEKTLAPLRGKNLACWCKESEACHADVLLELANGVEEVARVEG